MTADLCLDTPPKGLIASLLSTTDCQASGLVERGYAALSSPGAATAAMLTSLMVIAVALYGYRLMLGRGLALGEVVGLAIRLGIVVMLAASWSSFQTFAYDTIARAPTRIASDMIVAIDAPPPLDGVQQALDQIEQLSVGWRTRAGIASPLVGGAPTAAMALNASSFLLTLSTLGILVVSRVLLSLLIAVTPLVAGFLLFDATRGVLEGWLRTLATAAVLPLFVLILGAIELAILSPLLSHMIDRQAQGQFELSDVTPVGLVVLVFSMATFASVRIAATIAGGIRLARGSGPSGTAATARPQFAAVPDATSPSERAMMATSPVVRALEAAARRDGHAGGDRTSIAASSGRRDRVATEDAGRASGGYAPSPPSSSSNLAPVRARLARASRAAAHRDS